MHHKAGRLAEAETIYRQVLDQVPNHGDALQLLGLLAGQSGRTDVAIDLLERAIALEPTIAEHHCNLGEFHLRAGRWDPAIAAFGRSIALKPGLAQAHAGLARALKARGRGGEALAALARAVELAPGDAELAASLGAQLLEANQLELAIAVLGRAIAVDPGQAEAHGNLGVAWHRAGRLDLAIAACRRAVELQPDHTHAHFNLVLAMHESGQIDQPALDRATACFQTSLAQRPDQMETRLMLARVLGFEGRAREARAVLDQGASIGPSSPLSIRSALMLPVVYASRDELEWERSRVEEAVARLATETLTVSDPVKEVGTCAFYLAYQGKNERDLAASLATILRRATPSLAFEAPHCRARARGTRVHHEPRVTVGFLSNYFHHHTIGKLNLGFVRNLSREHFTVTLLRFPGPDDALARSFAQSADRVVTLPRSLEDARQRIAGLELDVLYYPEIGMDPWTYYLAHARLAPVQCVSWGHPVTTGIPTIDYFLSADPLEPADAAGHYTEELVRLGGIHTYYYEPRREGPAKERGALGLPEDATLYVCPQSLYKFHPDFDPLLGAILRGDPQGRLLLIEGPFAHWNERLADRFHRAFPDVAGRVVFLRRMSQDDFLQVQARADVVLDTPHFGGGNTSLEAFSFGTPIVTRAGQFLRDRITSACYRQMGIHDCIAGSDDDYVALALRLGTDRDWREDVRQRILARKERVYEDLEAVQALEQFLRRAVAKAGASVSKTPFAG
jgi:predicted O-linked N-acetylglucosamine transferase (SPINDLY family)